MSKYYGDINEDATIELTFNTTDSSGGSITVTDLVASDVQVYKDGVIQATPGAGVTLSLNIGTNDGAHLISIDTSNTTDASFYVTGSNYEVRLNGITVDTQTINAFVGSFSIENRFMRGTDGANTTTPNTVVPDVAGTASTLHGITNGKVDANKVVVDAIQVVTDLLSPAAGTMETGTVSYDNTSATTAVFYADDITEATANHYRGRLIGFTSGILSGQYTDIKTYALVSGEGEFTVTALTEAPGDNDTFVIV